MAIRNSLLLELSEADFQTILDEFEYIFRKGYLCHYVIDVYEINEFCYPLGTRLDDKESIEKTIGYISDEQYVFTRLFEGKSEKVILLDEYFPELVTLKKVVANATIEANSALFKLRQYYTMLEKEVNYSSDNEIKEIIRTKLTQALAIILDKELMGFKKLIHLLQTNKILHSPYGLNQVEKDDILKKAFDLHKGGALTNDVFNKIMSLDIMNPQNHNSNIRSAAFYRDARVIDRISAINNYLHSSFKKRKTDKLHLIYYFSSTIKSHQLFQEQSMLNLFPRVNSKVFNPVRNKRQLFLKYLCLADTYEESVYNVNYLKKKLQKIQIYYTQTKSTSPVDPSILDNLKKEFNHYREYFENNAILNKYSSIKKLLEDAILFLKKSDNFNDLLELAQFIKRVGENTPETTIDKINSLDDWDMQLRFSYFLSSCMAVSPENKTSLNVSTGKDIIRGTIHHLPILIQFSEKYISEKYSFFVNALLKPSSEIVIDSIHSGLISDKPDYEYPSKVAFYEDKLFKSFILLLAPEGFFPRERLDKITCEWVKNVLITKILPQKDSQGFFELSANYYYYIGWVLRRDNDIEPSIKWFKDAIKVFPDDGRFYHGLCLSKFCFSETMKKREKEKIDLLFSAIENAKLAIQKYPESDIIYIKSITALHNTIAYIFTCIFQIAKNQVAPSSIKFLLLARENLEMVREREGKDFNKYPEYLHTEAVVNYCEYQFNIKLFDKSHKREHLVDARKKIAAATIAIIDSTGIQDSPLILNDKKKYHSLQEKIIQEKQTLLETYFKDAE